jgi:hypothetical protein
LEFESPRYGYGDDALLDNLDALYAVEEKPQTLLVDSAPAAFRESLDRYMAAVPDIIAGHRDYRQMRLVQAAERYKAALDRNPNDPSVKHLLGFDELRRRVAGRPNDLWARYYLGVLNTISDRDRDAVAEFNELIRRYESLPQPLPRDTVYLRDAYLRLAEIYDRNNQPGRAAESRTKAETLEVPSDQ